MDKPISSSDPFECFDLDDKYTITGLIAEGSTGNVYAGETKLMHRRVAVKILHSELVKDPDMLLRFQMESEITSSLSHPNVVNICGSGVTADGTAYLAMDFVEGQSLEALLPESTGIDTTLCVNIFAQLARAIEYTHGKGLVHRDLKPSNVMVQIDPDGAYVVKLLNLGIAESNAVKNTGPEKLELAGSTAFSALYSSPEQILGKTVNFRGDIYSFGCLLFHALTGKPPYESSDPADCVQMHLNEKIPALAEHLPNERCASQLSEIVSACMQKDPAHRFDSTEQLRMAMEKLNETTLAVAEAGSANLLVDTKPTDGGSPDSSPVQSSSKDGILAGLSIVVLAGVLSLIPFLFDLNLSKAMLKQGAQKASRQNSTLDTVDAATVLAQTTRKVDDLVEQVDGKIKDGELGAAEKLARTAYLTSLSLPPDNPKISDTLFVLGKVFELRQNYEGANQAFNWVLSFNESAYGALAPQTVVVRDRIHAVQRFLSKESAKAGGSAKKQPTPVAGY